MNWKKYALAFGFLSAQLMAFDTSDMYLKADVGHSFSNTSYNVIDLGVGYRWNENWRSEFVWGMRPAGETTMEDGFGFKVPKRKFDNMTFMINTNYDFDGFDAFVPYVGFGVGAFSNKAKNLEWHDSTWIYETEFATFGVSVSLQAGVTYKVDDKWSIDLSYRAITLGNSKVKRLYVSNDTIYDSHTSHTLVGSELCLGVSFNL